MMRLMKAGLVIAAYVTAAVSGERQVNLSQRPVCLDVGYDTSGMEQFDSFVLSTPDHRGGKFVALARHTRSVANDELIVGAQRGGETDRLSQNGQEQATAMGMEMGEKVVRYLQGKDLKPSKQIKLCGFVSEYTRTHETYALVVQACKRTLVDNGFKNVEFEEIPEQVSLLNEQNLKVLDGMGAGVNPFGIWSCITNNKFSAALDCGIISKVKRFFGIRCADGDGLECPEKLAQRAKRANVDITMRLSQLSADTDPFVEMISLVVAHENILRAMKKDPGWLVNMKCGGSGSASAQGKIFATHCL